MTPKDQAPTHCLGPGCRNLLAPRKGSGRPRLYCSDVCGTRYRKAHPKPVSAFGALSAASAFLEAVTLQRQYISEGDIRGALAMDCEVGTLYKNAQRELLRLGRNNNITNAELAKLTHVSTATVSRSVAAEGPRAGAGKPAVPPGPADRRVRPAKQPRYPEPGPSRPRRPKGGTGEVDGGAQPLGPADTLSRALSHLHRTKGMTNRELADAVGVDASYISRILNGERLPSWRVTRDVGRACGADPADLRPLWDEARGYRVVRPDSLAATLRGLRLAAAQPSVNVLQRRTCLSPRDIRGALSGSQVPEWSDVHRLVQALAGSTEAIHPLWAAAYAATAGAHVALTSPLPAAAFG